MSKQKNRALATNPGAAVAPRAADRVVRVCPQRRVARNVSEVIACQHDTARQVDDLRCAERSDGLEPRARDVLRGRTEGRPRVRREIDTVVRPEALDHKRLRLAVGTRRRRRDLDPIADHPSHTSGVVHHSQTCLPRLERLSEERPRAAQGAAGDLDGGCAVPV